MPLREPRPGESIGFHAYPSTSEEGTLGDPETIIWSSIHHLCSRGVAEYIAANFHGVKRVRDIRAVAGNIKLYVEQAYEFYEAAKAAKPNTAPLIYYYSFLNIAKAICELRNPRFHERHECYHHGISWRPDPRYYVNLEREQVALVRRGVWHVLWESITRSTCVVTNPTRLRIKDMFLYCPEISIEVDRAFGKEIQLLCLVEPDVFYDQSAAQAWIRFGLSRLELKYFGLTIPTLMKALATPRSGYIEVHASNRDVRMFQSAHAANVSRGKSILDAIYPDVIGMNIFSHLDRGGRIEYGIPLQGRLPLRMPQLMVLYTILFWLGSLVRYDPHSVSELMDSQYWTLIDGFMSQSRLWLLEQFEWCLYQAETKLWVVR
jgi:hypothetical protein